jgi:hypothetical protein
VATTALTYSDVLLLTAACCFVALPLAPLPATPVEGAAVEAN